MDEQNNHLNGVKHEPTKNHKKTAAENSSVARCYDLHIFSNFCKILFRIFGTSAQDPALELPSFYD
jgi:hypothetical protein